MQDQENIPPASPSRPPTSALGQLSPVAYPVKNTFIHYGTPCRTERRMVATPKTVPPDFRPEQQIWQLQQSPMLGQQPMHQQQPQQLPPAFAMPAQTRPAAEVAAPRPTVQADTGAGVAPLRLFDFLPSPSMNPAPQVLQQQTPQATMQGPPMPFNDGSGTAPVPLWQRMDAMTMQQMPVSAPNQAGNFLCPFNGASEGMQAISWPPPWASGEYANTGSCPVAMVNAPVRPPPNPCAGQGLAPCSPAGMTFGGCFPSGATMPVAGSGSIIGPSAYSGAYSAATPMQQQFYQPAPLLQQ